MKKFFASAIFVLTFIIYTAYQYSGSAATVSYVAPQPSVQSLPIAESNSAARSAPPPTPTPTPVPSPAPAPAPAPAPKPKGQYVDGAYTGSVADAYYGYVQVRATVSGGKLADVQFLQYPNDRSTSRYINSQAMPILQSQALAVQNAQVDGVSGATDTSYAFRESLSSALSQAKS